MSALYFLRKLVLGAVLLLLLTACAIGEPATCDPEHWGAWCEPMGVFLAPDTS